MGGFRRFVTCQARYVGTLHFDGEPVLELALTTLFWRELCQRGSRLAVNSQTALTDSSARRTVSFKPTVSNVGFNALVKYKR